MTSTCHDRPRRNEFTASQSAGSALAPVKSAMMSVFAVGRKVSDTEADALEIVGRYWLNASDAQRKEISDELQALGFTHFTRSVSLDAWARAELLARFTGRRGCTGRLSAGRAVPVGGSHVLPSLGR